MLGFEPQINSIWSDRFIHCALALSKVMFWDTTVGSNVCLIEDTFIGEISIVWIHIWLPNIDYRGQNIWLQN